MAQLSLFTPGYQERIDHVRKNEDALHVTGWGDPVEFIEQVKAQRTVMVDRANALGISWDALEKPAGDISRQILLPFTS